MEGTIRGIQRRSWGHLRRLEVLLGKVTVQAPACGMEAVCLPHRVDKPYQFCRFPILTGHVWARGIPIAGANASADLLANHKVSMYPIPPPNGEFLPDT